MPHDETASAGVAETGEKTASGTREDLECNEEKATSTHRPHGLPNRLRPVRSPEQLHAQAPETQQLDRVPDAVLGSHHDGIGRRAELRCCHGCEVFVGSFRGGAVSWIGL
jgi:hypothetical protein